MYVEIKHLSKKIKGITVLNDISVRLEGGKIYGLQGKNGCGKTMLMRAVAGLIRPSGGEIDINGRILHKDMSIPRSIGVLIENPSFLPEYSGFQNLKMLASLQGGINDTQLHQLMFEVGLKDVENKKFGKYSLGMRQREGIAAAIMGEPELILLDEPINAIDEDGVDEIRDKILSLKCPERVIIIACHDKEEMELLADDIICLKSGKISEIKSTMQMEV